eukprot:g71656.t1
MISQSHNLISKMAPVSTTFQTESLLSKRRPDLDNMPTGVNAMAQRAIPEIHSASVYAKRSSMNLTTSPTVVRSSLSPWTLPDSTVQLLSTVSSPSRRNDAYGRFLPTSLHLWDTIV